jgi:tetratricopeptide (TPR) repeat protein
MQSSPKMLLTLVVSGLILFGASTALAQGVEGAEPDQAQAETNDQQRYRALTQRAAKAYSNGELDRALELFDKAYAIRPSPNLLYNKGRIHEKRGDFEEAIEHYEIFVTEAGVDIDARKDALERLKTLREVVALREEGEEVDEAEVHEQHEDRALAEPDQADMDPDPAPKTRTERSYTWAYVTLGLSAAAWAAGGYFALEASNADRDFRAATSRSAMNEAADSGRSAAILADSMFVTGAVLTGLGIYFIVSPTTREVPADSTTVRLTPQLGRESAGVGLTLDF